MPSPELTTELEGVREQLAAAQEGAGDAGRLAEDARRLEEIIANRDAEITELKIKLQAAKSSQE
jgi:hypothetical protein